MDKQWRSILFIDIETVPQEPDWETLSDTWKELWIQKISKTNLADLTPEDSYTQRASILAEFGKIICISTGYLHTTATNELTFHIKSFFGDDESVLLKEFIANTERFYTQRKNIIWAGHNIREFDLPFICRRLLTNGLRLPTYMPLPGSKPWEFVAIDTLQYWKFGDYKHYTSLNLLAHVLQIPTSKKDIDGSMVKDIYYKEKNLPRIVQYCEQDIIVAANIWRRFNQQPLLKEQKNITISYI